MNDFEATPGDNQTEKAGAKPEIINLYCNLKCLWNEKFAIVIMVSLKRTFNITV